MSEFGRGLPHEHQLQINGILNEGEALIESDDLEAIKAMTTKVEATANKLTETLMAGVS
jgi:hypothetical protein